MSIFVVLVFIGACGSGDGIAPEPDPSPTEPAVLDLGSPVLETERMMEHVRVISEEIGARVAGSSNYEAAVEYARSQLEGWGYEVEQQEFAVANDGPLRLVELRIDGAEPTEFAAVAMSGGASGEVSAALVEAGTGREEDFSSGSEGAIVLIQRQDVPFTDMARRATEAGAVAVVVANKEPGLFPGELDPSSDLPVVAVNQEDGESLRDLLAQGTVEMSINVHAEVRTRNLIARRAGSTCGTLSGGHLDSVPWAAGAGDNAAGSAVVLELARVAAAKGLSGHCFALFGAEELGLVGSSFYIASLTSAEREELKAYFNYDVAADTGQATVLGSDALRDGVAALADREGIDFEVVIEGPRGVASDHRSFIEAGIAAVMLTNFEFDRIHTPEDTFANLVAGTMEPIAALGLELLLEVSDAGVEGLLTPVP